MKKPIAIHRFPASKVLKNGDEFQCTFTVTMDQGDTFLSIDTAALYGVVENGKESYAARLAHITDTLSHFAEGIPERWEKGDCDPRQHIRRALRELAQAMLALDDHDD